jgi:hypothetical protein
MMKIPRWIQCAALAAACSISLSAQQAPTGFHTVNCVKVKSEKSAEFHKWMADVVTKLAESRVESGSLSAWYLLRAIDPAGHDAECDYVTVSVYPGAPPEPLTGEKMTAALKKAGLPLTAEDYVARRDSVATLISTHMYINQISVGKANKGGYMAVNYMKTANLDGWLKLEKELWKPVAEEMVKDGVTSGWSLNIRALGLNSDLPYQGVTVDVYPNWDAVFKYDSKFVDRVKKVHPDKDLNAMLDQFGKARTMIKSELYSIDELITSSK